MGRTRMYHAACPLGRIFENAETDLRALEAEGWVDTPAKLPKDGESSDSNALVPPAVSGVEVEVPAAKPTRAKRTVKKKKAR